ncbi:DUF6427 family protein [Mucilaginibacter sp.]|uniref:DUF6427 family protein n=1 Tax=Mucilaginibacter sp. TaxID=1882438 RepID=UPI00284AC523|nr:DUF6427 family protein [Mucilaginibacter sp.]MDR3694107.1 DUF6427 family protein [Mucilaginibacter sp.]
MINFFKKLSPFSVLWLVLILFVLRSGYLFFAPAKGVSLFMGPFLSLWLPAGYSSISPSLNVFLAAIMVLAQALLLNHLVNHFNLLGKPSFLAALMYITLSSLFTPFLVLSPPLICNFLVIWMLFKLINFYKNKDAKSTAFDLGMIIALGTLIYLPFVFLLLVIWIGLVIFKSFDWREWVAGIIGFITIFFFLAVYYYLNNNLAHFADIWLPLATKFPQTIAINYYNYLVLVPVVIILVLCFIKLQQNFYKSYIQVRKSLQLLLIVFLITLLSFCVKAAFQLPHFLLCVVPASVFFAYYFLNAKRKWFYEALFGLLVLLIVYFQFNTF